MTSSIDITPEQREALLALLHRHLPGVTVRAYGSRVKGTAGPNSDLDLVVFHFSFSAFQRFSVSAFLRDPLGNPSVTALMGPVWKCRVAAPSPIPNACLPADGGSVPVCLPSHLASSSRNSRTSSKNPTGTAGNRP